MLYPVELRVQASLTLRRVKFHPVSLVSSRNLRQRRIRLLRIYRMAENRDRRVVCPIPPKSGIIFFCYNHCPREESNLHLELRRLPFYPLNYRGVKQNDTTIKLSFSQPASRC